MAKGFKAGVIWTILGSGINSAAQWVILITLTRFGSMKDVGDYSLILSIVTPISILTAMSLRAVYVSNDRNIPLKIYILLRYILVAFSFFLAASIFVSLSNGSSLFLALGVLVWGVKANEYISDIYFCQLYQRSLNGVIGQAIFKRGLILTFVFLISFTISHSLLISMLCCFLFALYRTFAIDRNFIDKEHFERNKEINYQSTLKILFLIALPLGISSFLVSFLNNIPKYFIEVYLTRELLGVFSSLSYIVILGNLPISALAVALRPRMFNLYKGGKTKEFFNLYVKGSALCVVLGAGMFLLSKFMGSFILELVYGDVLVDYLSEFTVISASSIFIYLGSFTLFTLTSIGSYKHGLIVSILALLVTTLASLLFASSDSFNSIVGYTIAWMLGAVCLFAVSLILIVKSYSTRVSQN